MQKLSATQPVFLPACFFFNKSDIDPFKANATDIGTLGLLSNFTKFARILRIGLRRKA